MLRTWTVRAAVTGALTRLTALATDARLTGPQQTLVANLRDQAQTLLTALGAGNTIPAGQRATVAQRIEDRVTALTTLEADRGQEIGVDAFYNAMDLAWDAARAIRLGLPSFVSDLGPGL